MDNFYFALMNVLEEDEEALEEGPQFLYEQNNIKYYDGGEAVVYSINDGPIVSRPIARSDWTAQSSGLQLRSIDYVAMMVELWCPVAFCKLSDSLLGEYMFALCFFASL